MNEQVRLLQIEIRADLQIIAQAHGELNPDRYVQSLDAFAQNPA